MDWIKLSLSIFKKYTFNPFGDTFFLTISTMVKPGPD